MRAILRRRGPNPWGLLAVVLALAGQLVLGMVVPNPDAARIEEALRSALVRCSPDAPRDGDGSRHHDGDGLPCTLASAAALPAPLLVPFAVVPEPRGLMPARASRPNVSRAADATVPGAAFPRGPPGPG